MRALLALAAIGFSATAFAQSTPPKIGNKPLVQLKPKEPMGCKLVGTVKGTKLWAGDCVASGLRGAAPATETNLPVAAAGGAVRRLVGIEGGVVSGVFNLESPGVDAPGWRPRHEEAYHAA